MSDMSYADFVEIVRLESSDNPIFHKICEWNYNWWGKRDNKCFDAVRCNMEHSLCTDRLPQTYVAIAGGVPAGMYQFAMSDDLESRPDIYPWLINVYVDVPFRGKGICRRLMMSVRGNAENAGLSELFLYTRHVGLYEKFGWEFVENVQTFRDDSPVERLYKLEV